MIQYCLTETQPRSKIHRHLMVPQFVSFLSYFFTDLFNSGKYQTNSSNTHDKVKKKLDFKENSLITSSPKKVIMSSNKGK